MRRAARVDDNHTEIVKALRKIGCTVSDTSAVGRGFPDIVVGYRGRNFLIEIKDGKKSASRKKLTPDQEVFHNLWRGKTVVIESVDEAIEYLKNAV